MQPGRRGRYLIRRLREARMFKKSQTPCLLLFIALFLLPLAAWADCAAPAKPAVRICSPSPNATVVYNAAIDFNSTPAFGAEIVKFIVYDNDRKEYEGPPG